MINNSKRVLLIKQGSLGDIFLMLGAIKDIADYACSKIDVLTSSPYAKIFKRSPNVDNVYIDDRKSRLNFGYLKSLRNIFSSGNYDLIVDFQNSPRTVFYRRWLAPNITWSQLGTVSPSDFLSEDTRSPVLAKFQFQLHRSGISSHNLIDGNVDWLCDVSSAAKLVKIPKKKVVLLPGASLRHRHKIWPYYDDLANRLIENGVEVFIVPGPDDLEQCRALTGELLLIDGHWLDFFQLAGVIREADFIVGNDSGPTHLAASLGKMGIALFGGRSLIYADNMRRQEMEVVISENLSDIGWQDIATKILSKI